MGLNYTALLSIIVGLSVLIPYVGAFLATIPVVVVSLLQFGIGFDFYMIVGLYLILQALDGNLLVPILFSDAVKLHPVAIMLAVFIFGGIFGFWGAFFSKRKIIRISIYTGTTTKNKFSTIKFVHYFK